LLTLCFVLCKIKIKGVKGLFVVCVWVRGMAWGRGAWVVVVVWGCGVWQKAKKMQQ